MISPRLRLIPVWIRIPAGIVAAAAVVAIVLLIRDAPGRVADEFSLLWLVADTILYVWAAALFGYVALTGLPPSHLWRSAGRAWWPAEAEPTLTPDLHRYLRQLRDRHPELRECWLLDPAGTGEHRLLAIVSGSAADGVRSDWDIRRKDVRLYLLEEESRRIALAWGRTSPAAFSTWEWEPQTEQLAEFRCPIAAELRFARRLWVR